MAAVCAQESGGSFRPVAYFSKVMPLPVQGMPACLRALAASAMAVELSQSVTIGHNTILHTSHQVTHLLKNITTQHMTSQRLSGYEVILLGTANLQITDTPLSHATNVFVDGSCSRPSDDTYKAAYSVVQLPNIVLETKSIPVNSAQAAELIALTRACHLFANHPVNIFSDSRYAFGVVHDFSKIWQQRGYVTTDGKSIAHPALIDNLLQAIQLPSEIAIIHCGAHTNRTDEISLGNALADQVAKTTASSATPTVIPMFLHTPPSCPDSQILQYLQTFATQTDLHFWEQQNLTLDQFGLYSIQGKVGIPENSLPLLISQAHGIGHRSSMLTLAEMQKHFIAKNLETALFYLC
ncbi:uncharacterized protein LOC121403670 [Xenopus laevis]|uniref:Uncharacterized protein LOC121403670 n=1 Tax=Xenopus laevis TaxID=8355 RepID=A0A8J1N292_XENLA|nr:uncharacterized protein LOC121403670 [Xenopus laevis]